VTKADLSHPETPCFVGLSSSAGPSLPGLARTLPNEFGSNFGSRAGISQIKVRASWRGVLVGVLFVIAVIWFSMWLGGPAAVRLRPCRADRRRDGGCRPPSGIAPK